MAELFVSDIHGNYETFSRILRNTPEGTYLHVVGDIYDRGPEPDKVMDALEAWPDLDIQWGNHDVLWMGASLGQPGSVANVVRICARYGNLDVLEKNYGIDLGPLREFARKAYANDPCVAFGLKGKPDLSPEDLDETIKVQKAMAYIQFKAEHQLIQDNPNFGLVARDMLHKINYEDGTIRLNDMVFELKDKVFPTINPADPFAFTGEEAIVLEYLITAFQGCEKLQRHMQVLLERGSLYKQTGDILLFHACVPLAADGSMLQTGVFGRPLGGRALFDAVEAAVRDAFTASDPEAQKQGADMLWYLWLGVASPLFAKSKMATFELYQLEDKKLRTEIKNSFYSLLGEPETAAAIFTEFGMNPDTSRIVCGHVPVKVKDGEDPVKCSGKLICIDGGMARAYQPTSGIGGFILVKDEAGLRLGTLPLSDTPESEVEGSLDALAIWRAL
ncbi:MAG: fructose-bisphosphatase class III [Eggerthellaceae bacterium]|nr:fructose-bisphosphatase class III [Eggerthellaceae bacterium]